MLIIYSLFCSGPAEKRTPIRHDDNLKTGEGKFVVPEKPKYQPGERPKQVKPQDNLRPEGSFDKPERPGFRPAERAKPVKPVDNLKTGEGEFEGRRKTDITHTKTERAEIKKHRDQITINEGRMETDTTSSTSFKKQPVQRNVVEDIVKKQKLRSNITLGDDTTILRTTNQMNYNTITTRKDTNVEKSTDVTDTNRIRDGTIAITTMKVTTVLENEKDHTPIQQVIRKAGQTNVHEEVIHKSTDADVINRQNIVNEQYHVKEVNQNVVNKKYIVSQRDANNLQSIESRKTMNQSQITLDDRNTSNTTSQTTHHTGKDTRVTIGGPSQVNGISTTKTSQHHQSSNIINNQNDQNIVNRSTNKQITENIGRSGSTVRTTTTTTASGSQPIGGDHPTGVRNTSVEHQVTTQTSPNSRQHHSTLNISENTRNVSSIGDSMSKTSTSHTEQTSTHRSSSNQTVNTTRGGDNVGNLVYGRTMVTSTPIGRQQNYTSDILNVNNAGGTTKISTSTSQSDKINNQLHLRESTSNNAMSTTSSSATTSTSRYGKSSAHNSTSNISSIIRDGSSPTCPMHRASTISTEHHRRDYVSSNSPDHSQSGHHSQQQQQQHQHHRKNVLTSSTDVNNSVFHRKANLSTNSNEALHSNSMSSTGAIQRKSISNLHDQAIYNTSSDRKSYSSLHRQGKETVSHSTSSSTVQSHQHHGSGSVSHSHSSSHIVSGGGSGGHLKQSSSGTSAERTQKIVKKDNLTTSLGGEFYGKSESKAYGSFATGHQQHTIDRTAVSRRSNQSSFSLGDGQNHSASVYRREYATVHLGPCPAAHIEKSTFTHTRDTKSHKFFKPSQK